MKLLGFDLETTGLDTHTARPVQVGMVIRRNDRPELVVTDLAAVEVPPDATAIHGITTAYAMAFGRPEPVVIEHTIRRLVMADDEGCTLVGANLAYDLTLLDHAARRAAVPTLCDRLGRCPRPVWDVYVAAGLDFTGPPVGQRTLTKLVRHYLDRDMVGAHDAIADVRASLDVAREQMRRMETDPTIMHDMQSMVFEATQVKRAWSMGMTPGAPGAPDPCWPVCHGQHNRFAAPPAPTPATWDDVIPMRKAPR